MKPDWVPLAARVHFWGMALGTALLVFLVYRLARSGLARRYPAFTAYLLIAIARAVQGFLGVQGGWWMISETAAMAAKGASVLEAAIKLLPRPCIPTLGLLVAIACILGGITLLLPAEPNRVREFERWRVAAHVGLAGFTAAGLGWLWRRPRDINPYVLAYFRIWCFRLVSMAALGFLNYPAWPEEWRWPGYYMLACGFLVSGYAASLLWIRWARRWNGPG